MKLKVLFKRNRDKIKQFKVSVLWYYTLNLIHLVKKIGLLFHNIVFINANKR